MFSEKKICSRRVAGGLLILIGLFFGVDPAEAFAAPVLGSYTAASVATAGNIVVMPTSAPSNVVRATARTTRAFKGTFVVNPATGAVRVINASPAGTYTVFVTGYDAANVRATSVFVLNVVPPSESCPAVLFNQAPSSPVTVGSVLRSAVVGDFNGDGRHDLSSTIAGSNSLSLLLGNGTGGFAPSTYFATGDDPVAVAVGDFNGDGFQDLANANEQTNYLTVMLGDGAGNFGAPVNYPTGADPRSIAVGDLNFDGKADIVAGDYGVNRVSVLYGNGDGTFQPEIGFVVGAAPISVLIADLNGDSLQDIATANLNSGNVSVLLRNTANTNFLAAVNYPVASNPTALTFGDFNGDGQTDLAASNFSTSNVSVLLRNVANNGFEAASNFAVGTFPMFVASADFNNDGLADLVSANRNSNNVSVLLRNAANDGFEPAVNFPVGDYPWAIAVGDFNADNRQDLAVANFFSSNISILLRQCFVPTAARVSIGGRVRTAEGRAISGARVSLTDANGAARTALTNQFGFYRFADVSAGETYILSVSHKRYAFGEPTQVYFIDEAREDLDFTALTDALLLEKTAFLTTK